MFRGSINKALLILAVLPMIAYSLDNLPSNSKFIEVMNDGNCNITIYTTDGSIIIDNEAMTNIGDFNVYNLSNTALDEEKIYLVHAVCDDSSEYDKSFVIEKVDETGLVVGLLVFLIVVEIFT